MKKLVLLTALWSLLLISPLAAKDDDYSAIEATVFNYFDGYKAGDRARLNRAFDLKTGRMMTAQKQEDGSDAMTVWPITDVIDGWVKKGPRTDDMVGKILSVDIAGSQIATVTFDFNGAYTDILTLAKIGDDWKIVNKLFITLE